MDSLTHFPALPPPAGVTPNFINPQSQALMVVVTSILCLVFIIIISLLRFYTILWIKKSLKADDIVCAFAFAGSVSYTAVVLSCVNVIGRHQWDVPILPNLPAFLRKLTIVIDLLYGPIAFCAKLSLFLFYYRLFARRQSMRYLIYLGIGSAAAMYTTSTIVYGYLCLPRSGQGWIEAGLSSRCNSQFIMLAYARGPFNVLSDLYLLFLPLPPVLQLQLPLRKRLGIAGIFLTGSFACTASIFGLYFRLQLYKSPDRTWNLAPLLATVVIELNVGTICASLPFLPAFYHHHRLRPSQVAALKNATNKITPFRSTRKMRDDRLETDILGSIEGEGKFLKSGNLTNITGSDGTTQLTEE
ncbi:MAG: hypothetical protein Q9163_004206 [Psora crenata]